MLLNEGGDSGDLSTASGGNRDGVNVSTVICYRMKEVSVETCPQRLMATVMVLMSVL